MTSLNEILISIGQSVDPMMRLVSGASYLMGIALVYVAIEKFKRFADYRAMSASGLKAVAPVAYLAGGAALLYLPTMLELGANTFFGSDTVTAYHNESSSNTADASDWVYYIKRIVQLSGVVWFVQGTVMMIQQAANAGRQHSKKGMAFVAASIFAMNVDMSSKITYSFVQWMTTWR